MTYNNLIKAWKSFADAHANIGSFGCGELYDINGKPKEIPNGPILWLVPVSHEQEETTNYWTIDLLLFDNVDKGDEIQNDVLSDTNLTLRDAVIWSANNNWLTDDYNTTQQPFTERFADAFSGWSLRLRLEFPNEYTICDIPLWD